MARLAKLRFPPSEHWPCVLRPTASITGSKSRHNLRRFSRSREPLAIGEGEEAVGGVAPNWMESHGKTGLIAGSNGWLGELHVCLS